MIPPPPFNRAMTIKPPVHIPPAPEFIPRKARTQEEIMNLLKSSIFRKMVPPPPFSKAMTIKPPVHIPKAPKFVP